MRESTPVHTVLDSPLGPLTLVGTASALRAVYMVDHRHMPPATGFGDRDHAPFQAAAEQFEAYFAGRLTEFDLPLEPVGTPFQKSVWAELAKIPYGTTVTYGELALRLGRPTASRAVGAANGRNPLSVIVPCHRVVGSTGGLTGYAGGTERKQVLLDLERRTLPLPV